MSVIFGWLEIYREVTSNFIEKGFFELLANFFGNIGRVIVKFAVRPHVINQHKVGQIETDYQIPWIFFTFNC